MTKKRKTHFKTAIILILVAALLAGGGIGWYFYAQSRIVIDVVPLSNVSTMWWGDSSITSGRVSTDVTQRISVSPMDMIDEILVSQGDTVSIGDPLLSYDTTLLALQVEIAELNVEIMKNRISNKDKEIAAFKKTYASLLSATELVTAPPPSPSADVSALPTPSTPVSSTDQIPATSLAGEISVDDGSGIPTPLRVVDINSKAYSGMGTAEYPYRYFISSGAKIDSKFIVELALAERTDPLYLVLETREKNLFTGEIVSWLFITINADGSFEYELKLNENLAPYDPVPTPTPTPPPTPTPTPTPTPSGDPTPTPSGDPTPTPSGDPTPTPSDEPTPTPTATPTATPTPTRTPTPGPTVPVYTRDEARKIYAEMQADLTNMKLDLRQLEIDFKSTSRKLDAGTVKSTVDGVVISLIDFDTAMMTGEALMVVSGGEGYYVKGVMSELDLNSIMVGQQVDIMSWFSNVQCTGEIVEIGIYPSTGDTGFYPGGSLNVSYYPFTAYVGPEYTLMDGEYVEMTLNPQKGANGGSDILYIDRAYVRADENANGRSYVYITDPENENRLQKVYIQTGKLLWGSYVEIRSGLTGGEYIAFPYGKDVKEGVKTQIQEQFDFFMY